MAAEDEFEEAVEEHDQDLYNENDSKDKTGQKKKDREDKKTMNPKEESVGISYTFFNNIQQRKSA